MPDEKSYISSITLPNNTVPYYIKDSDARADIVTLKSAVTNNGTFVLAWDGNGTAVAENIPEGVTAGNITGTLAASEGTEKKFYLVHSSVGDTGDIYDEYITVQTGTSTTPSYSWERIGSTKISLSDIVTNVTLNLATTNFVTGYNSTTTASVVGTGATFKVTNPTVTVTPSTTYIKASASNGGVSVSASAQVNAITGYSSTTTTSVITDITVTQNQMLETASITGVAGTVTTSKATASDNQTSVSGFKTSTASTAFLKGWTVSGENLTFTGVVATTLTTTQFTFSDVTAAKAASSLTKVATGQLTTLAGNGAKIITSVTHTKVVDVLTGLGSPTTAAALGTSATFKLSNQTITLSTDSASANGRVKIVTGISGTTATGGTVTFNTTAAKTVLTSLGSPSTAAGLNTSTTITVTKGNTP